MPALEPVSASEIAPPSECADAGACQLECESGGSNACSRWGDWLYPTEPARAEALWRTACERRDDLGCLRMMALSASSPREADSYARQACSYGAVPGCELLGSL
ncbi:hypothetical protein [Haliangium ochraceum]|uniref:hypothetical protein n=1 Tax=Haliangium ochraceum TaxID=80816 RepID=UPI00019BA9CF|nr:hypothetical protein [Haliangium ochraceum]